jgi:hypothetical protein
MKKILFVIIAVLLVCAQIYFIAFMRGGALQAFLDTYSAFGIEPAAYTRFMFSVAGMWWMLPLACALLSAWTIWRWSGKRAVLVLLADMASLLALVMAPYSTIVRLGAPVG